MDLKEVQEALESLKKSAGGTNTTKVESMVGQGGATQVFHTPSNSDPGTWAGSTGKDVPANGATDGISANGTDYDGRGVMKSIFTKMAKGLPLTSVEKAILKAFSEDEDAMDKAFGAEDDKDDKKDKKDMEKACDPMDDKKDMEKSFNKLAHEDPTLREGFEMSDFLKSFSNANDQAMRNLEARVIKHIDDRLGATQTLNKSLAGAVASIGEVVTATHAQLAEFSNQPARGPKAVQNVHVLEKGGYQGQGQSVLENMNKSQIANEIAELVIKGEASAQDVLKYEHTRELSPALREKIISRVGR